jgi:hypothetical protein
VRTTRSTKPEVYLRELRKCATITVYFSPPFFSTSTAAASPRSAKPKVYLRELKERATYHSLFLPVRARSTETRTMVACDSHKGHLPCRENDNRRDSE